jgi:hypothetical protein
LDLVFFGWGREGDRIGFQPIKKADGQAQGSESGFFIDCCREIEAQSKWRYSGETDILIVDFEVAVSPDGRLADDGQFSFQHCIYLPVEQMVAEKQYRSLDHLVQELVRAGKEVYDADPMQAGVFEISDRIGWTRGRKSLWEVLKKKLLKDWKKVYDDLRPFAVCDLRLRP